MGVSPPTGVRQTLACQTQLHRHELPTTHSHHPTHLPLWCLKHCLFRDFFEISFHLQNAPERGVAFQVITFGHQYTWENGFVWEMCRFECLRRPPLILFSSLLTVNGEQGHPLPHFCQFIHVICCCVLTGERVSLALIPQKSYMYWSKRVLRTGWLVK